MLMTLPTGYGKSLCYQSLPLVYDEGRTILVAILFQFLLSLDDFNPQHEHFYVIHSTIILCCYVGRYVMCQYGFVHNSCTCSSPDLLHTCSSHPSREGLAPRLASSGSRPFCGTGSCLVCIQNMSFVFSLTYSPSLSR